MTNFAATRQIIQVKSSGFVMNRSNLSYVKACAGHSMKFLIALGAKVVHTLDYWCERGGGVLDVLALFRVPLDILLSSKC